MVPTTGADMCMETLGASVACGRPRRGGSATSSLESCPANEGTSSGGMAYQHSQCDGPGPNAPEGSDQDAAQGMPL